MVCSRGADIIDAGLAFLKHEDDARFRLAGAERRLAAQLAARLKRSIISSGWTLFDADDPEGMPPEWRSMPVAGRLEMFEALLPGISKCERVELRSSSARVSDKGAFGGASHAYIRLSDPTKLEVLRAYVSVAMVLKGLSFPSPRHSRTEIGKVIGHTQRTLFDTAVWVPGRLIFCAKPDISQAPGYEVADADIRIVNGGTGPLDVSWLEPPEAKQLVEYRRTTGVRLRLTKGESGFSCMDYGQLTLDTEITVKGEVKPLKAWLTGMKPGDNPATADIVNATLDFLALHAHKLDEFLLGDHIKRRVSIDPATGDDHLIVAFCDPLQHGHQVGSGLHGDHLGLGAYDIGNGALLQRAVH